MRKQNIDQAESEQQFIYSLPCAHVISLMEKSFSQAVLPLSFLECMPVFRAACYWSLLWVAWLQAITILFI